MIGLQVLTLLKNKGNLIDTKAIAHLTPKQLSQAFAQARLIKVQWKEKNKLKTRQ